MVSTPDRRRNGGVPVTISWSTMPNEKMSLRWSMATPVACSGDMYAAVPTTIPDAVKPSATVVAREGASSGVSDSFARPKSMTLAWPSPVTMMLAGFRSRWMMPVSCARESASAISIASSMLRDGAIGPRWSSALSGSPRTSSITMNVRSSTSAMSWMTAMCGCSSAEAARASCTNRARRTGSATSAAGSTLMATSRSRRASRARYTSPIPPTPIVSTISYGPSLRPATDGASQPEPRCRHEQRQTPRHGGVRTRPRPHRAPPAALRPLAALPRRRLPRPETARAPRLQA